MTRATIVLIAAALLASSPARADVDPVASFRFLVTGNGFGFQVFDANANAITQFLERPYRYMRPNPSNPDGEGIVRRNLAFDTYFGLRTPGDAGWLSKRAPSSVSYLEETNIIRSVVDMGAYQSESLYFAPYGFEGNAMVMILRVTNTGSSAGAVDAFSIHNFKMGSASNPDEPGANGESLAADGVAAIAETGPGGGTVVYVPIGGATRASCATDVFQQVAGGSDISGQTTCSGTDRVGAFQQSLGSLGAGETATWGVAVLYDDGNGNNARAAWNAFVGERDAATLLQDTLDEWDAWRRPAPGGLSAAERKVWRQSETVLRMGQILEPWSASPKRKNHGMILASLPPGGWHSGWVRDAVYAIVALARTGHHAEAKAALNFFLDAEANKYGSYLNDVTYRISTVRYFGNGEEEADFSGQPTRNVEIDGWGLFLWAARVYVDASGDTEWLSETTQYGETVYDVIRDEVAEALAQNLEPNGIPIADASIWEVHWGNRQHFLFTAATTARGFCDMAALSLRAGEEGDRDRYKMLSERTVAGIRDNFVDQNKILAGSLEQLAGGSNYMDGSVTEAFTWGLIPYSDPIATATINAFSMLLTEAGGYKRVQGSSDQYDTDEWILIDLRASDVFRGVGQTQRADQLLDWVTSQASANYNLVPELYNTRTSSGAIGAYSGSIPMVGYGAGAFQLSVLARAGSFEHRDCGTEDPMDYVDAGPITGPDAGPDGPDGGVVGVDGRTGMACACDAGNSAPGAGGWLAFGLVALVLTRRKRG